MGLEGGGRRRPRTMESRRPEVLDSLRQRIVAGLHLGVLKAGDRLPSLRRAAADAHADPRVVLAAYRRLAVEGLVSLRPRSGVFVQAAPSPADSRLPEVPSLVVDVFLRGLALGIAPTDLRRQARACLDTVPTRAACFECNDDQIHALCRQVQEDYGFEAVGIDAAGRERGELLPAGAATADLVLTTAFHAAQARRLGRRLRRPVVVATLDTAFVTSVRRMLEHGQVWWICTDPRFAAKIPRMFPGAAVTPFVLGRDRLDVIPEGATVYATRRAAGCLPPRWRRQRAVTIPRVFSAETARALLEFQVGRNLRAIRAAAGHARPA
jgi:DNA-binding transcriptional regulator YhcF (GntR family)